MGSVVLRIADPKKDVDKVLSRIDFKIKSVKRTRAVGNIIKMDIRVLV